MKNVGAANLTQLGYRRLKHADFNELDVNWSQDMIMRDYLDYL